MNASEIAKQLGHGWTFGVSGDKTYVRYDARAGLHVAVFWKDTDVLIAVRKDAGTIKMPTNIGPWRTTKDVQVLDYITSGVFETESDLVAAIRKGLKDHYDRVSRAAEVLGEACGLAVRREDV